MRIVFLICSLFKTSEMHRTKHASGERGPDTQVDTGETAPHKYRTECSADSADYLTEDQLLVYQDAFNIFDKDCDGRISNDKLTAIMKTVGDDVTDQELQDMINAVDADGTGQLDFSEFLSVFTKNQQIDSELEMKKAFAVFDKDEDGFISVEDLKSVLTNLDQNFTEQEINDMVRETDTDGDGKISYNEFLQMMRE